MNKIKFEKYLKENWDELVEYAEGMTGESYTGREPLLTKETIIEEAKIKYEEENIKELEKGIEMIKQGRCIKCGKKLKQAVDPIAKKKTGYLWYCECSPKRIISIG